ncbi:MAG TPA: DUF3027 domain-containing protein [Intrasporangium sp.]|uniref:DUF3027 domain-containing protein n=1 Tax=Intrasporangium sp. TaxID=1925024 RepID=UPI002D771120|nr:DUF3027 domain-containing protein [Intrasporangium sp.]HET7398784.1 DUF3027 domain-containing protein [Intrasporangium sp.]
MSAATAVKDDAVLLAAADLAREVLTGIAEPGTVGAHLGMDMLGERLAMHWFECTSPGYVGWRWGASVARVPRGKVATVCETNLLPGPDAVLAPEWLPYAERLAPGDLGPGDVLPYKADDPYLEAGFEATGDEEVDQLAIFELGLGRPRVLSALGREAAATRWYAGESGPLSDVAVKASAQCSTCGYFLPLPGALRAVFGVCANEWSPSDSRVVSLDHGCGAHSETDVSPPPGQGGPQPVMDELAVDLEPALSASAEGPGPSGDAEAAEDPGEAVAEPDVAAATSSTAEDEQSRAGTGEPGTDEPGTDEPGTGGPVDAD